MPTDTYTLDSHFATKDPVVRQIYDRLLLSLKTSGPVGKEAKKTSIHLTNGTAFAGVATRKGYLILTIRSDRKLDSPRIHKQEQVSARRYHSEVKLASPSEVDPELIGWLKAAYSLST